MQDNNDADTLVNMCVCLQFTQKSLDNNAMLRYVRCVVHAYTHSTLDIAVVRVKALMH